MQCRYGTVLWKWVALLLSDPLVPTSLPYLYPVGQVALLISPSLWLLHMDSVQLFYLATGNLLSMYLLSYCRDSLTMDVYESIDAAA